MDATTDQIKREIEEARERISENTSQLGERIRQTFDWRQQVGERPWAAVGIAASAGFVLGAASAKVFGRGMRAASGYGEQYTYDRIGRDVEAQAPGGDGGAEWTRGQSEWLRGRTGAEATAAAESWRQPQPRESAWSPPAMGATREPSRDREPSGGREPGGMGRPGAVTGLLASLATAMEPQLREIGRTLADQLKDLSTHFIGQGKEVMKQKVDQWRSGSGRPGRGASSQGGTEGGSETWPSARAGDSTLSSESAGAWPSGSTTPGVEDTRTPQSRESATGERRAGGTGGTGI